MRLFISYRRDDAAGYAGRLEGALEQRLGRGSVFRDLQDIPPGEDFAATIRRRLADAQAVVVLIGPRWAGGDAAGARRIDDPADFVRLEVQAALESGVRLVPVLLPGATMPPAASLPAALRGLSARNAMSIADPHWEADVDRLLAAVGGPPRRALWPWVVGAAVLAGAAVAGVCRWWPPAGSDLQAPLLGAWQGSVRYDWGDRHAERFVFERHAGGLTGTASFLGVPRPVENLRFDGRNLHFETRTEQSMGDATRTLTHAYAAELHGTADAARLVFRLQSTGGFRSHAPVAFEAQRPAPAASTPPGTPAATRP